MTIQILGTGCPKCRQLEANAREALEGMDLEATVDKVTDLDQIADMGVMITPALAVDGVVKSAGKVLATSQIARILEGATQNG